MPTTNAPLIGRRHLCLMAISAIVLAGSDAVLPQAPAGRGGAAPAGRAGTPPQALPPCSWAPPATRVTDQPLPDLPGARNDSQGHFTWVAQAAHVVNGDWQTQHTIRNLGAGTIHVDWHPGILKSWVRPGQEASASGPAGGTAPQPQPGDLDYGKTGNAKPAPSYPSASSYEPLTARRQATVNIALTVQLGTRLQDLSLKAQSLAVPDADNTWSIRYCLALDPGQASMTKEIAIDWIAAASPQFADALRRKHNEPFAHLTDQGTAEYTIAAKGGPALRSGTLVVTDRKQQPLAAASAPAYGPAR